MLCSEVFKRDAVVDWPHVREAPQRIIIECAGNAMTLTEFITALDKLCSHKSPDIKGVSPNMPNASNGDNKLYLFEFIRDWMMNDDAIICESVELSNCIKTVTNVDDTENSVSEIPPWKENRGLKVLKGNF